MSYKFKEINDIINVTENGETIARYQVDRHWEEKNVSIKDNHINVRLYNRLKGYLDCIVELNNDNIQKIPNEK